MTLKELITKETRTRGAIKGQNTNFFNNLYYEFKDTMPKMSIRKYNEVLTENDMTIARLKNKVEKLSNEVLSLKERREDNLHTMIEQSNTIDRLILLCEAYKKEVVIPELNYSVNNRKEITSRLYQS